MVFSPGDSGQTTCEKISAWIQGFSSPEAIKLFGYSHQSSFGFQVSHGDVMLPGCRQHEDSGKDQFCPVN
jgi:hypothetical protein